MFNSIPPSVWMLCYGALINITSYALMYSDKKSAIAQRWRISESTLLFWAFIGGAFGAKLAQRRFRHKTNKRPFKYYLNGSLLASILIFYVAMTPDLQELVLLHVFDFFPSTD